MKPTLLLLHGALGTKQQFRAVRGTLEESFELYDLNFEGHGGRESNQPFSIALFTENVKAFMDENSLQNVNIFGYSMGGYVGLDLAVKHPGYVNKIVTLGTKFNWTEDSTAREVRMLNPDKIKEKVPKFAQLLAAAHAPLDWENMMHKTAEMMKGIAAGASLNETDLNQLKLEVIIGVGDNDQMVTEEESKKVAALLPKGRFRLMEGFPHPIDQIAQKALADYILTSFN